MKNQLLYLLLSCCFLLGSIGNVNADCTVLDGNREWAVHNCKTGQPIYSFSIPDSYLNKDGSLAAPLEITLTQNGKSPAFSILTKDLNLELPVNLSGTFEIVISVGSFSTTGRITI